MILVVVPYSWINVDINNVGQWSCAPPGHTRPLRPQCHEKTDVEFFIAVTDSAWTAGVGTNDGPFANVWNPFSGKQV